jgi:hypothetical protein
MTEDNPMGRRRVRLVWRWKQSGTTGTGPWTHRSDVVEGWFESLTQRWGETVEHWIELEPGEAEESRNMRAWARADDARGSVDGARDHQS